MNRKDLIEVRPCTYEMPKTLRWDMRVPARIYANAELLDAMLAGETLTQLANVTTLPGVVEPVYGMPDMHEGYGFPVGGVAATRMPDGVVSPGGVGFDINCGVRLVATPLTKRELGERIDPLLHELSRAIPSGMGQGGALKFNEKDMEGILAEGSPYLVRKHGLGIQDDLEMTESGGCLKGADPARVSDRARERGRGQVGTMGSGNHFVEVQQVEEIFDAEAAGAMGLFRGQVTVLIHTGSRGLGHQVCTDYVKLMDRKLSEYRITLPDRQLSCAPASSPEGRDYLAAMAGAANFAWSNRQAIAHQIRQAFHRIAGVRPFEVRVVYDVAHNIAKVEEYDGVKVCVHRKGATRAFGPGHPEMPKTYRTIGQPVFIPGSMGTASFVLAGMGTSAERSWGSTCHGAGRRLSRTAAKKRIGGAELRQQLEAQGIRVKGASNSGLAEEAPFAYKDVEEVAEVVEAVGLARRVARLKPFGVIKG